MNPHLILLLPALLIAFASSAQDNALVKDKPGTFTIRNNGAFGGATDTYNRECVYSDAQKKAGVLQLDAVASVLHQLPMMEKPMGFDAIVMYINAGCDSKYGFGLQADVKILFEHWMMINGKLEQATIEPPQFIIGINQLQRYAGSGFDYKNIPPSAPDNPLYDEQKRDKISMDLQELFFAPGEKQTLQPGIDRYGEVIVLFNPSRPAYWQHVTVREVYRLLIRFYELDPDKTAGEAVVNLLESIRNNYTEEQKDEPAYLGPDGSIGPETEGMPRIPVLRANPAYWDRNLSSAPIQFITLELPEKEEIKRIRDELLSQDDGSYYQYEFMDELKLADLQRLIDR